MRRRHVLVDARETQARQVRDPSGGVASVRPRRGSSAYDAHDVVHRHVRPDPSERLRVGLLGVLSPEMDWWKNISLQSRKIELMVMRDSVFAAMIWEDLARVDPGQQVIRRSVPTSS